MAEPQPGQKRGGPYATVLMAKRKRTKERGPGAAGGKSQWGARTGPEENRGHEALAAGKNVSPTGRHKTRVRCRLKGTVSTA